MRVCSGASISPRAKNCKTGRNCIDEKRESRFNSYIIDDIGLLQLIGSNLCLEPNVIADGTAQIADPSYGLGASERLGGFRRPIALAF